MSTKPKAGIPMINRSVTPAFTPSLVNQDSLSITSPKQTRKKRPLTDVDPLVSKSISMRNSLYTKLQDLADVHDATVPGGGNLSVLVRKILEKHLQEIEK